MVNHRTLSGEVDALHYQLRITTNIDKPSSVEKYPFPAVLDLTLTHKEQAKSLDLHSSGLTIHTCYYTPEDSQDQNSARKITYNAQAETVSLSFATKIQAGTGVLHIEYSAYHG